MATNEHKDWQLRHMLDEQTELWNDFQRALDALREIADDFSEGSQQRWLEALRECSALRDELWLVQQRIDAIDAD